MFSVLKRSLSTCAKKFTANGQRNTNSTVKLDYLTFTPKESAGINAPIFLYHGKFTSKNLWTPVAGSIADATKRQVFSVDMRNHGGSEHTTIDGSRVPLIALDLIEFMKEHNLGKGVLFGHCLGGRPMMQIALNYPEVVEKLIVFDMGFNIPTKPLSFLYLVDQMLLKFIKKLDPYCKLEDARGQLSNTLSQKIKDQCLIEVLSNSLEKVNEKFQYSFNLEVMYESLWKGRVHHLEVTNPYNGQCLFLYGNSGFVVEDDFVPIRTVFPNAKFVHIDTGHYGMIEDPPSFSNIVSSFINGS